jgi:hypothetical protein
MHPGPDFRPRTRTRTLSQFVCAVTAATAIACTSVTDVPLSEFTVRIDSITGPTAVSGGVAAEQRLWGVVGPSGCTSFKEIRATRVPSAMDVTVIGQRDGNAACRSGSSTLNGAVVRIEPLILYDFMLIVHQPDGSSLVRRIYGE